MNGYDENGSYKDERGRYSTPPFSGSNNSNERRKYNNKGYRPSPNYGSETSTEFIMAIKTCFYKYVEFNGRASRAEFWWWILFVVLITGAMSALPALESLVGAALFLPTLAVSWRRLHDTGRSGSWWFINFVPLVGWIFYLIWVCQPGEYHPNRFGPNPYGYNDGQPPVVR